MCNWKGEDARTVEESKSNGNRQSRYLAKDHHNDLWREFFSDSKLRPSVHMLEGSAKRNFIGQELPELPSDNDLIMTDMPNLGSKGQTSPAMIHLLSWLPPIPPVWLQPVKMLNGIMPFSINALTVTGNFRKLVSSSMSMKRNNECRQTQCNGFWLQLLTQLPTIELQEHWYSNHSLECPKLTTQIQDIFSSMNPSYEEFCVCSEKSPSPVDKTPWSPFCTLGDFEFVEITLASLLNQQQVNALLDLFARVTQGAIQVVLKNDAELCKACDAAAMELTLFSRVKVKVPYKKEECTFEAHICPLWEWALNILENPFLGTMALSMNIFTMSPGLEIIGGIFNLPNIKNAMPFGLILYADKTNLSSFGTARSYPIIVHCANLPVEIQNRQCHWQRLRTFQVPEDAEEEGKLGYTTLKHVIWHKSFKKLLLEIEQYLKTGCMMALTCGCGGKCPCPNVFWLIGFSDLHLACSFDQLHYGHGFWGKHVFGDLKVIVKALRQQIKANVEKYVASFPHWQNLTHFNQVIHVTFSDGNKLADISKDYTKCIMKSNIDDIRLKGAACNYSTWPNESMHKPIQDAYEHHSNGRDIPAQVLWVDHQVLAMKLLRLHVDHLEKSISGESDPEVDVLGAHVVVTQTLEDLEENGQPDMAFHRFCQRFWEFHNDALLAYGYQVKSWISLPTDFMVEEYCYLLVNYELTVTWNQCTDHLHCNLSFFDIGNMEFILAQPFMTRIGPAHTIDHGLRLKHVKTVLQAVSIFIPLCSII
ncbi:hypothetical protein F5J12DRAFT_785528 [Pisolithus orientalis]|uniref:uncharacterized protein n=1 Tax=Pisolithus orientalis TaxID=936130 RepID=UPI0022250A76|nr:uncharacterized protein F5J12DRAFT_785528 [Pisolithus orientalis]KAI5995746.1 hypothetical protein F5J12DRAFT_785528 [Pisolithus orientalis]